MFPLLFKEIFEILYFITIVFMVLLVIQQRSDPMKTIAWLLVVTLLPLLGIILYFYFGKNYRKEKIFSRKGLADSKQMLRLAQYQASNLYGTDSWPDRAVADKSHIIKMLYNTDKALLTERNRVKILVNGKVTFEHIIAELEKAEKHIHLEYYIIEDDRIGNEIRRILTRKARAGLEVRVIYDEIGCWSLSDEFVCSLKMAGVQVYPFMPVRFPYFTNKINYRNHRKIIVIDGKVGFVGGLNIADRYISGSEELGPWRDTHLKIEGEAVYSLQSVFLLDWYFVSRRNIHDQDQYFPPIEVTDRNLMQIVTSGPDSDWASIMQTFFSAIATAKSCIYISTPYFLPNESILTALRTAALSGVDVRMLFPEHSDSRLIRWSSFSYISQLLDAGIKVYLYRKGFTHSKLMMVDDIFCSIGTANMDIRSFDQNFEVNALIYNQRITVAMRNIFMNDIRDLQHININDWNSRSRWITLRESIARLFSPLL